jgi:penicillin-binding protein 2
MGFAPMNNPRIAIAVYVENGGFGADFAVPIAGVLFEQYIKGKLSPAMAREADELQKRRIGYGKANR